MDKGKTKILLIEDDETIRTILTSILLDNGYAVVPCEFLRDASKQLDNYQFNLIISYINLSDGNCLDFSSHYKSIPFIAMSASDYSTQAKLQGALYFIRKPFNIDELLDIITLCL